ncbi:MAG: AlkZ family DNA glycosylase, partial [Bacteroidetes bacterium]|nr:AlkZ family DNA glycosylase [Bacteroidota bacterium]
IEEGLGELEKRYFTSHGPATLKDFSWWSGLSVTNSRLALESIKSDFQSMDIDNQTYWYNGEIKDRNHSTDTAHLLPAFDEFLISYKDRTASIPLEYQPKAFSKNGIFYPTIVINGKVIGLWKRTIKKDTATIETQFLHPVENSLKGLIDEAAERYGNYLGKKVILSRMT